MSNLALLQESNQLIIVQPNERLLNELDISQVVESIKTLLGIACKQQVEAWMITDGTIRIQHNSEQDTIKKVLGLCENS
jgi:hypothetical protein